MTAPRPRKHYDNAPVVEALIDIQVEDSAIMREEVEALADSLSAVFPTRLPLHQVQMGFEVAADREPEFLNEQMIVGYRLDRPGRVLQLKTNGFSYSHLPPYSDWLTFSSEAMGYWKAYQSALAPRWANRVAVRMINRLPLPSGDIRLAKCLNFYPTLPDSLPSDARSLFMQLQLPMPQVDPDALTILGLYSAPPAPGPNAIMLDIDFIVQRKISIDEVFGILERLGDCKDEIFEACITDEIRKLIQ
ncbi:TIGR04255 family protein [Tardiphaga sp. 42S5]|uniref:TIGR04255 family protein n=1 Tax=Tardiphaga sp. 42S5 TaxID=1404799 RepID=UPI002A5A8FE4|nr:TIGR04255 family protein [Tardiphaga sp. 42S5]WPO39595.1 TIGR04255 family protein [Tardiphaga sp. 42S5]